MIKRMSEPFLGTTPDVNRAFPDVEAIDMMVAQDPYGYYCQQESQRVNSFTKSSLPSHIRCVNPRCQQGGLPTQNIVLFHEDGEYDFACNGHEGSPAGRRKGDPCDNRFKVMFCMDRGKK